MEGDTAAAVAEDSTEAGAADFMEVEAGFTAVEVSLAEATLVSAVGIRSADIVAATMADAATTEAAAVMAGVAEATAGAAEAGATAGGDGAGVGAGDLDSAGRIGDMAGDIRMATTATRITRPTLIILTRPTALPRTI
jgi:hypothetical protein